jgi:hypothetical protein
MVRQKIELLKYRGQGSTVFTGRPEGKLARADLNLDEKDTDGNTYVVIIPKNTTSFNSSFFLGLFFDSIKKMGSIDRFYEKYMFEIEELDAEWQVILERNLAECRRKATNELNHSTGIDF